MTPDFRATRVWRYRLADDPGQWLVMIHFDHEQTPMDSAEALRSLQLTYGAARVLEVRPHQLSPTAVRV